ncbi:hypothetical protein A1O1_01984 [Capronia coronata CBS 617.96]|uniref:NmrA-like domain-containing protein n=1 Tax=Capronia coronata CBS 617.96 TaxID=1182541 RepID=W9YL00_9EURO|nr:uncharacterized protein A1O1_01984 [Capronia coronata CBS 617.96]EXJ93592.1 hypothetical protein A1O1_01984 [Capronia coronata CBS 617.96]
MAPQTIHHRATSILVIGAGELGSAILDSLTTHPLYSPSTTKISLAVRPSTLTSPTPEKQAHQHTYREKGVHLVPADLEAWSEDDLARMLRDGQYTAVIHAGGFGVGAGTMLKLTRAVLSAAAANTNTNTTNGTDTADTNNPGSVGNSGSVEYYVPWQFGADYDAITRAGGQGMFSEQIDVRDLLRSQQRVDWVIVSCGIFMSFLFQEFWGVMQCERSEHDQKRREHGQTQSEHEQKQSEHQQKQSEHQREQSEHHHEGNATQNQNQDQSQDKIITITALNSWSDWITTTTATDIAKCTAELLYCPDTPVNQPVYIAGDTLTYSEFADAIERAVADTDTDTTTSTSRKSNSSHHSKHTPLLVRNVWPLEYLREESRRDPDNQLKRYRVVFAEGRGLSWPKEQTWSWKRGMKMEGVEEWVKKNWNWNWGGL